MYISKHFQANNFKKWKSEKKQIKSLKYFYLTIQLSVCVYGVKLLINLNFHSWILIWTSKPPLFFHKIDHGLTPTDIRT